MIVQVDVWLRGDDFATTQSIEGVMREPDAWTDEDIRHILHGMLQAMHRLKHSRDSDQPITLRGLSWIVNPYEEGGVVVAIEIGLGAAVAGPFLIEKGALEAMISRVLAAPSPSTSSVH
jgi:hypothetical protein